MSAALLLLVLCVIALDTYAAVADAQSEANCAARAYAQTCYTIDTSRPEWLSAQVFIYLPLVLKSFGP